MLTIAVTALIVVALVFVFRKRLGMLDRYIIIRDSVNLDVFICGETPESLWGDDQGSVLDGGEAGETL